MIKSEIVEGSIVIKIPLDLFERLIYDCIKIST